MDGTKIMSFGRKPLGGKIFLFSFILIIKFHFTIFYSSHSQPIAEFYVNDSSCLKQNLTLQNQSTNSGVAQWDFCLNDLEINPLLKSTYNVKDGVLPIYTDIIFDNGKWYGFSCDFLSHKLFRLDFGNNLDNTPTQTDLGNPGNLFNQTYQIKFTKFNDIWYAFIVNYANNNLIRLVFGNGIDKAPSASSNLGSFGILNRPIGLEISLDDNNYIITISNNSSNNLAIVNFGNSLLNNPSSSDAISIGNDIGLNGAGKISILKTSDSWYGLICSINNGKIFSIDFGESLFDTNYTSAEVSSVLLPDDVEIIKEGLNYYGYVVGRHVGFYRLFFGEDISSNPIMTLIGKIGIGDEFRSLKIVRQNPGWYGFVNSRNGSILSKVHFINNCLGALSQSNEWEPKGISYESPGNYSIELSSFDTEGNFDTFLRTIVVRDATGPDVSILTNNTCIDNENIFTANSSDNGAITSWNWDFGDGTGMVSGQNVNHQFLNTGNYEVKLSIEAANGCSNTAGKTISIYNPPTPDFSYTSGVTCSNSPLSFTNNTIFDGPDSVLTYTWNMNDEAILETSDPSYIFTSGGEKTITLNAAIPGCTNTQSQIISITPGPLTSFSFAGSCAYDNFQFSNATTGDNITGYQWSFGDGYASTVASPSHVFASAGTYVVSLTASNASGCNTSMQQVVPVNYIPQLNFTNDLACSENSVTFYDQSSVTNANIMNHYWTLSNNSINYNEQANGASPTFIPGAAGEYTMTLVGISNYGCADTLIRAGVSVKPSPVADFTYEHYCLGDTTILSEAVLLPDGVNLLTVDWLINGLLMSGNELKYKFPSTGSQVVEMFVRADNLCTSSTVKPVSIISPPEIDMQLSSFCADQPVLINAEVNSGNDSVQSYKWSINDKAVSSQQNFTYIFKNTDEYAISLLVSTANNCFSSLEEIFTMNPSPVSAFEVFPSIGASPLVVQFTDKSKGASSILYDFSIFNDDQKSEFNPVYTYQTLGKDWPIQIASNEFGCTDTSFVQIEVVIPVFDLAIANVASEEVNGKLKLFVELMNNGTIIVNNPNIRIDIDERISLNQQLEGRLMPGDIKKFEIDFEVFLKNENINYICFSTEKTLGNYVDSNPYNNTQCLSIEHIFTVLEPYPNPSNTFVELPIILPSSGGCYIRMVNQAGKLVFAREFKNLPPGLNVIKVDLSTYSQGIFLFNIRHGDHESTKKIVIQ
jgi:PKD repeat protein